MEDKEESSNKKIKLNEDNKLKEIKIDKKILKKYKEMCEETDKIWGWKKYEYKGELDDL
jgi:hypothetical protein